MKEAVAEIVGRTITGVVVKHSTRGGPDTQVFLLFGDGRYYEFYSDSRIQGAGGIDSGGLPAVTRYMADADRWPILAHVATPSENAEIQTQVALGRIVTELRKERLNEGELMSVVKMARDVGHDPLALYSEALPYRPAQWSRPPSVEELRARLNERPPTSERT